MIAVAGAQPTSIRALHHRLLHHDMAPPCCGYIPEQIRRPTSSARSDGSDGSRLLLRAASAFWYQLPPRIASCSLPLAEATNSHTLPARSATPNGLSEAGWR